MKKSYGFTMIELLVVVGVISVLAGVTVAVLNGASFRGRARDGQRISDLKKIQTALELYFTDNRRYPIAGGWIRIDGSADVLSTSLRGGGYLNVVPIDPKNFGSDATPCINPTNYRYNYYSSAGATYVLTAIMENSASKDDSPCTSNTAIAAFCMGTAPSTMNYCYAVINP